MPDSRDTIAAIATAPGKSGIGIIRISGPKCLDIAQAITTTTLKPRSVQHTDFLDHNREIIDKGIVIYFKAPGSYTGEDVVEFQGHGSMVTLNLLLKEICRRGARHASPGEFSQRAFLNGKLDLVQAEAVADLIASTSEKSARQAIRSLEGRFSARILDLVEAVTTVRVYVESALDFSEEEIDVLADAEIPEKIKTILDQLDRLLNDAVAGKKLREGLNVVIVGRPNVGKSSLLNLLSGSNKAIVTGLAGTTRDIIEDTIYLDGLAMTLIDTAGIRDPENEIEAEGIKRSQEQIMGADVLVLVTDNQETTREETDIVQDHPAEQVFIVHNKIDLYGHPATSKKILEYQHIFLSASNNEGVDYLIDALQKLVGENNSSEDLVLARERHIHLLTNTRDMLTSGLEDFHHQGQVELLAECLKSAQKSLGEITGEVHNDDLLGEIFSRFCIGK
ncbi:MAG: tRNA uridine-5-carboxymethylaminomethyl(34) synthesis GTPase MnmE [Gammaproteobacteria bacterium]|nr:tRNA uridine-5-carboxymethylaminomethyl(34) synthesis GTPase MnmE [Gammaproteobacteria bacterium]